MQVLSVNLLLPDPLSLGSCATCFFPLMYEHDKSQFAQVFLGSCEAVAAFWQSMVDADHPNIKEQPALQTAASRALTIPLAIHGGGVPVSGIGKAWGKLMDVYSL